MHYSTETYNRLKLNILPPPIKGKANKIYDASRLTIVRGVMRHNLSSPLLQLAKASCGRVFCILCLVAALAGCENPDIPESSPQMEALFRESCHLMEVQEDSIPRFADKFFGYIGQNPSEKNDPFYPDICENISDAAENAGITIMVNTEWEGQTVVPFE